MLTFINNLLDIFTGMLVSNGAGWTTAIIIIFGLLHYKKQQKERVVIEEWTKRRTNAAIEIKIALIEIKGLFAMLTLMWSTHSAEKLKDPTYCPERASVNEKIKNSWNRFIKVTELARTAEAILTKEIAELLQEIWRLYSTWQVSAETWVNRPKRSSVNAEWQQYEKFYKDMADTDEKIKEKVENITNKIDELVEKNYGMK